MIQVLNDYIIRAKPNLGNTGDQKRYYSDELFISNPLQYDGP